MVKQIVRQTFEQIVKEPPKIVKEAFEQVTAQAPQTNPQQQTESSAQRQVKHERVRRRLNYLAEEIEALRVKRAQEKGAEVIEEKEEEKEKAHQIVLSTQKEAPVIASAKRHANPEMRIKGSGG